MTTNRGGGRGKAALKNLNSTSFGDSMATTKSTAVSSRHSDAFFLSGSSSRFLGSGSAMVSFEDVNGSMVRNNSRSFFTAFEDDNVDEDYEEYFNQSGKKRRLSIDQVQFLERSFEVDNKLEPDRKVQLAKELDLQPRQVAIWFQNRRARWKTKQMEKDYDTLQASFNDLKSSYDAIVQENKNLKAEVLMLSEKLAEPSETSKQSAAMPDNHISNSASEEQDSKAPMMEHHKLDDFTSSKSDIFQSESPRYVEGVYSPNIENVDSSYMFELDTNNSDSSSQDEDEQKVYLTSSAYMLPLLKHDEYASSSNLESSHEDNQPFWPWSF